MIVGTVRNSVTLTMMDQKWQQKKSDFSADKRKDLSAEEAQIFDFKAQMLSIREGNSQNMIDAKLLSGAKLTQEEIEYLRKNNPQALKQYEEEMQERAAYQRQLRNCKSKEEVDRVKTLKMGEKLAACKEISNNPNIPKGKKKELLEKLVMEVNGITQDHNEFLQSAQYAGLPETDEEARERRKEEMDSIDEGKKTESIAEEIEEQEEAIETDDNAEPAADSDGVADIDASTQIDVPSQIVSEYAKVSAAADPYFDSRGLFVSTYSNI